MTTDIEKMADIIVEKVKELDWVTFVELERTLKAAGFPTQGHWVHHSGANPNIIFWTGMSIEFGDALVSVWDKRIFAWPSQYLTYLIDGGMPNLKCATSRTKPDVKKPVWFPITFRVIKKPEKKKRGKT